MFILGPYSPALISFIIWQSDLHAKVAFRAPWLPSSFENIKIHLCSGRCSNKLNVVCGYNVTNTFLRTRGGNSASTGHSNGTAGPYLVNVEKTNHADTCVLTPSSHAEALQPQRVTRGHGHNPGRRGWRHLRLRGGRGGEQERQTSFHLDSLLMTRMRAPFSSLSLWLSDLSSVKTWGRRRKETMLELSSARRNVHFKLELLRWHYSAATARYRQSPLTTSGLKVVFQWRLTPHDEDMLHGTRSCRWGVALTTRSACEKGNRAKPERERETEGQFLKSRSRLSWGAMTKNNRRLCQRISSLLETNNNPLLSSCDTLTKTGGWEKPHGDMLLQITISEPLF